MEMNIDEKIAQINEQLRKVSSEMERLRTLKGKLEAAKEKLQDEKHLQTRNDLAKNDWSEEIFPWSQTVGEKLKSVFGIDKFRSQQLETINVTMSKVDVILLAPTGGGKSLCYQLPAVCDAGITLVVSPLVSLMEDQIYSLKKKGVAAELLSNSTDSDVVNRVHKLLTDPGYSSQLKLLYVCPERMAKSKRLMSALQKCYQNKKLERIAIDEVHCCSVMGHDFRPEYKFLGTMKTLFPNTPIIGVTATASRKVLVDVQKMLNIRGCLVFSSPFNRPNLFYGLLEKPDKDEDLYDLLANLLKNRYSGQSGIIYALTVKNTESIVTELLQRDCKVRAYHAYLEPRQRSNVYHAWRNNEIQAVVATIAFGMGIDKSDARFVIHHTLSKSMENFYQESGRCGRDGNYAECILLYRFSDIFKITTMTFAETNGLRNSYSMLNYCIDPRKCRRDLFSNYFTEVWSERNCGKMCDHCFYLNQNRTVVPPKMNVLVHYRTLLKIIDNALGMDIRLTPLKLVDAWLHKGPAKLRVDVPPPSIDRFYAEQIVAFLIMNNYLREDFHFTPYSTNSYIEKGPIQADNEEIEFQPARAFDLPSLKCLQEFYEATKVAAVDMAIDDAPLASRRALKDDDQTARASTSRDRTPKTRKRVISSSSDESSNDIVKFKSSDLEKLIEKKVESKLRRMMEVSEAKASVSQSSDDVVILTPKKDEVIEID